jgi:hypothetical protein
VSLDLEVRSDDDYSKTVHRDAVTAFLLGEWHVTSKSDALLVYDQEGCWVEISLGQTDSQPDVLQWVGFRVPAGARFRSGEVSLRIAMGVAQRLGWRVHDPQRDDYVPPSELEPGPPLREAIAGLLGEAHQEGWRRFLSRTIRRLRRQSVGSIGYIAAAGFIAAAVGGRIIGYRFESHPRLVGIVAVAIAVSLILGDVVLDVLGEVHQDAVRGGAASRRTSG